MIVLREELFESRCDSLVVSDSPFKLLDLLTQDFELLHLGEVCGVSLRAPGVQPYGLYSQ